MDFDSEEECSEFNINESYAESYNNWRQKEELQKLKDRYQTDDVSLLEQSSSSSESEDEDAEELTPGIEKDFLTTLGCLKKQDPRIYDKEYVFFREESIQKAKKISKDDIDKPLFLRDYERKIIVEKKGELSDEESDNDEKKDLSPSYFEEQTKIKESLKSAIENNDEDSDNDQLLMQKMKTKQEQDEDEKDYMKWLKGQSKLDEKEVNTDMEYLKNFWTNPKLDSNEKFLRDFIVNKTYLNKEEDEAVPEDEELLSEDEKTFEKIEEFEHKYNFRFEEPDPEFIKRYPRTMDNSLRRKDNKRAHKREEVKERKLRDKEKKKEDIKMLKILKRNEIMEKLEKIKEITGNQDLGIKDADIDGDFDPETYDKKMQEVFNEEYYDVEEEDQKPEFSDYDEEEHDENWDNWTGDCNEDGKLPDCEDPDFNMDADYDPSVESTSKKSRKDKSRRKGTKFSEALSQIKPVFDPNSKSFEEYFDEYYKLDYEDIIDDMPVRFKYRKVQSNDFGLSINEILAAKERDLNKWCSVKKMCQYRTDEEELYDLKAFKAKSQNVFKKKKLIPSLFDDKRESVETQGLNKTNEPSNEIGEQQVESEETNECVENDEATSKPGPSTEGMTNTISNKRKRKRKKGSKLVDVDHQTVSQLENTESKQLDRNETSPDQNKGDKKRKVKDSNGIMDALPSDKKKIKKSNKDGRNESKKFNKQENDIMAMSDNRLKAYGLNPKKFKNKIKYKKNKT